MARIRNKTQRQFERHLKTDDPLSLVAAMREQAASGGHEACLAFLDGLPGFFEAVAQTYEQYEDKNKMALRNLDLSSEELNEANRKLERLNRSMEAMLESLGPALLFFNKSGQCADTFSRSCLTLLEAEPGGQSIWDVLKCTKEEKGSFDKLLSLAFKNISAMTIEDLFRIAPQSYRHSKGLFIKLNYRPIFGQSGTLHGILLIGEDVTEEAHYKALAKDREQQTEKILRLIQNRKDFMGLIAQIEDFFLSETPLFYEQVSLVDLKGDLHTMKGLAGSFYMNDFVEIMQRLESSVVKQDTTLRSAFETIERVVPEIFAAIEDAKAFMQSIFGEAEMLDPDSVSLRRKELLDFYRELCGAPETATLQQIYYQQFLTVPISDLLRSLDQHIRETAAALGKPMKTSRLEGDNFRVPTGVYDDVFLSLVHLVRNAIDHGIERSEERVIAGKSPEGQIMVRAELFSVMDEPWFRIIFKDDGAGVDTDKIRQRMKALGMDSAGQSDQDVVQNIFMPGFSSKRGVSVISGRGIGLSAVTQTVRKIGGSVSVTSDPGKGTTFVIDLPFKEQAALLGDT
jgi:two-component system chemotaxis sensor kinase CheA